MESKVKLLIIGGDSFIGSALACFFKKAGESVISTTRNKSTTCLHRIYLDLMDEVSDWKFHESVDTVVFCSGITKVDQCESNKLISKKVNVESVCKLADIFVDKGARIIFLSSNAVFDGSKEYYSHEDNVSPITEYGRQKAEVEKQLIINYPSWVTILRLTKVLGARNPLFDDWSLSLKRGDMIYPFTDMYIAPIPLSFVVSVIRLVVDRGAKGILHLSGDKDFSYADIAFMAVALLGLKKEQVNPISAGETNRFKSSIRTNKTALSTERLKCELGITPPGSIWTIQQAFTNPEVLSGA